ncbi:MAG: (Fe-S)-binding protein [Betaproteobacteria bacterium]|jgi:heterodisulfide reductase subunit D|nr:(Fe-S)-binding protein [Betaproteobacteria bacterium]MDH4293445.1 (Fe-S)-binding protein [Betaproteobacteria bacterium]MDH5341930.1 (Fe-S)-binding protein [Betaproteobacteria bacterium]
MNTNFADALQARTHDVLDHCTRCGRCFEVCPMPAPAGLSEHVGADVVGGVLDIIRGGSGTPAAERWAQVCSGSGHCIPACPESVNPRFMLALTRVAIQRRATAAEQRAKGSAAFANMGRGVRVLSRMQLPAEVLRGFRDVDYAAAPPDVVFYTGCNVLKTPHIVLLSLDILDALGVTYRVMGGPGDCCGVLQFRAGDFDAAGRIAYRTTDRFAATGAAKVLAWCPTCTIQIGENVLPGRSHDSAKPAYDYEAFVVYLASQLDRLRPLLRNRVNKRVGLHEHPGVTGVFESAIRILKAIPGLEYVELEQTRAGYMCNTLQPLPAFKREMHRTLLEAAAAAKVDALAGVYHACHRELCSHEIDWPFAVVNFLELIGESMGITREDQFKRLKKMQDTDAILAEVTDLVAQHGLSLEEVRAVIEKDLLGEQPLALKRSDVARGTTSAPG